MKDLDKRIHKLLGIEEAYKAPERLLEILYYKARREELFKGLLEINADVSKDWFRDYFQATHADRKNKSQDFTPDCVTKLLSKLTNKSDTYEVACGSGAILITKWWDNMTQYSPLEYKPSFYLYHAEELSDRVLPFLLCNLMIRGMNCVVNHCDSLTRVSKGVFFIQNDKDDHLGFSSLNLMPYNETVMKEFNIYEWDKEKHKPIMESNIKLIDKYKKSYNQSEMC